MTPPPTRYTSTQSAFTAAMRRRAKRSDEPAELVGLGDLLREVHELADGLVAVLQRAVRGVDVEGVGADARETGDHRRTCGPRSRARASLSSTAPMKSPRTDHRRPHQGSAAAALQGRALALAPAAGGGRAARTPGGSRALRRPAASRPASRSCRPARRRAGRRPPRRASRSRSPSRTKMSQRGASVRSQRRRATCSGTSRGASVEQRGQVEPGLYHGAQVLGLRGAGRRSRRAAPRRPSTAASGSSARTSSAR